MTREIIKEILNQYAVEANRQFGASLKAVVLYGSCAREDYDDESDIDLLVLLDDTPDKLPDARAKMRSIADRLDMQYDVVVSAVFQNYNIYHKYKEASGFYQNVEKEGVVIG
jgi:predicted nucleotidyltransferase